MSFNLKAVLFSALLLSPLRMHASEPDNTLTAKEKTEGWSLLFDGHTTGQWREAFATDFPVRGWIVRDGELRGEFRKGMESGDGGDIVTREVYRNFEMYFDWKLGPGGNSGVKYFVEERQPKPTGSQPGYEYQIIDDATYIYQGKKLSPELKTASIYDVVAADKPDVQIGVWHRSHIRVQGDHLEHWLDGKKVVDADRKSALFQQGVTRSKFHDYPGFARISTGHILLQDHGHNVAFKNLKIRQLP